MGKNCGFLGKQGLSKNIKKGHTRTRYVDKKQGEVLKCI